MWKLTLCGILASAAALIGTPTAPDPTIIAVPDGGYYVVATGKGLPIYHSDDLRTWREVDRVFDTPVPEWAREAVPKTGGIWAPDIVRVNGLYYCYYAVSEWGSQRSVIGLAVNKTLDPGHPDYRWIDRGLVIDSDPARDDFNAIDSALFLDDDGGAYLFWGSYWSGIKVRAIDPETGKPDPAQPEVLPVAARTGRSTAIEGAYVIEHEGSYYLFVSWDACCNGADSTYKVMVGRAEQVLGPYVDYRGTPMIEGGGTLVLSNHGRWRGPGHNSVLQTGEGDYLVHHVYDLERLEDQRVLQVRPLYWTQDGWPVVGEPLTEEDNPGARASLRAIHTTGPPRGDWLHTVDYDDVGVRCITLHPSGHIGGAESANTWTVEGNALTLRWQSAEAPGGTWVDAVVLEAGGRSYIGRNQKGQVIRGVRP